MSLHWLKNGAAALLALVVAAGAVACTDERGLILEGEIKGTIPTPPDELYVGLWVGKEPAPGVAPVAFATWGDSGGEAGIALSENQASGVGQFRWETKTHVANGTEIRIAGFIENINAANGIPDENTKIYLAEPDPIKVTKADLVEVNNGSAKFKTALTISLTDKTYDISTAVHQTNPNGTPGAINRLEAAIKQAIEVRKVELFEEQLDAVMEVFHPWYSDLWRRDFNDLWLYFSGELGKASTLEDGPLAGLFEATGTQIKRIGTSGISLQPNTTAPAKGVQPDIIRPTADVLFKYLNEDDRVVQQFWKLSFRMEQGVARIIEWEHQRDTVTGFDIDCAVQQVSAGQTLQPKWGASEEAAEQNYKFRIERYYPEDVTWGAEKIGVPGSGGLTVVTETTVARNLASDKTILTIVKEGGSVLDPDTTRVYTFKPGMYYRLKVTTVEAPIPPVSATCYLPEAEYAQSVRGSNEPKKAAE